MAFLDFLQPGFQKIFVGGIEQSPARGAINFTGGGIVVTDDALNNRKDIAVAASGGGGNLPTSAVTASGTSVVNTAELIGTRTATITRNLPSGTSSDRIMYCDILELCATYSVTIDAGAGVIVNGTTASTYVMNTDGEATEFLCIAAGNWMRIR
jgi:hypothetical protein